MSRVRENAVALGLLAAYVLIWAFLAIDPLSRSDWVLENLLVWITLPLLIAFHRRLGIRPASNVLLFVFYTMHALGGHWSYSNVPFIPWEAWGFERNHFDRIVHFSFGLLLWLPLRDALLRFTPLGRIWGGIFALSLIWSFSGAYEVIEWAAVAVVNPELGQEFLGAQGDEFDAAKDMGLAMGGALIAFGVERLVTWLRASAPTPVRATLRGPNAAPPAGTRISAAQSGSPKPGSPPTTPRRSP